MGIHLGTIPPQVGGLRVSITVTGAAYRFHDGPIEKALSLRLMFVAHL